MKTNRLKIIGYGLYLTIVLGLFILLILIRNQYNWIAGGLRELFTYSIIGLTLIFLFVIIVKLRKRKAKRLMIYGIIGLLPFFASIPFFKDPIYINNNEIEDEVQTLELTYIAWACDCANWATHDIMEKYHDNDSLADNCIFIEPASSTLKLPDTLGWNGDLIRFTGQFYKEKGFPKRFSSFENPNKARVFRYTEYDVIISNYKYSRLDTDKSNE